MSFKKSYCIALCLLPLFASAQNTGSALFDDSFIHDIRLNFSQSNFWDSLVAYKQQGDVTGNYHYMPADVVIDGTAIDSVGVRLKGNSSFGYPGGIKRPIKIDFNRYIQGQDYDGLKKINLNNGFKDPTMLREKITLDFCREVGVMGPRCTFANVYINNTLWGFYDIVEQIDRTYLDGMFADNCGNLYKGDPDGKLQWFGTNPSSYTSKYELDTSCYNPDFTELVDVINTINNTPAAQLYDSLEAHMDTWSRIRVWAVNNLFVNLDSYTGSGHNYYMYLDPDDERFHWIIWDVNEAFGNFNMWLMNPSQIKALSIFWIPTQPGPPPPQTDPRPMNEVMIADPVYKARYINTLCNWLDDPFSIVGMDARIDSLADFIRSDYYADPNKAYSNSDFETNLSTDIGNTPGLKDFVQQRWASVQSQLAVNGCTVSVPDNTNTPEAVLYPNPAKDEVYVSIKATAGTVESIALFDISGRCVRHIEIGKKGQSSGRIRQKIDLHGLSAGLYTVRILSGKRDFKTLKLICY